jgi:hypothetical protein
VPIQFFATPFRFNGKDVECASLDGKVCLRGGVKTCQAWVKELTSGKVQPKPLTCGAAHKAAYGITGYDTPGHWCYALKAFYDAPATYCNKVNKTFNVTIAGCGPKVECSPSAIVRGVKINDGEEMSGNIADYAPEEGGTSVIEPNYDISVYFMNRCKSKSPLFVMMSIFFDPGEGQVCQVPLSEVVLMYTSCI